MLRDADASIAVTVEGYRYSTAANAMRTRVYSVMHDVRRDHGFCSIVTSPSDSPDLKPRVNWAAFHETVKLSSGSGEGGEGGEGGGRGSRGVSFAPTPPVAAAAEAAPPSPSAVPPAAAAAQRISANLHRNSMDVLRSDAAREASAAGAAAAAASPPAPASAASSSSPSRPSAATASFAAAAAAAAAATAEATRAPPPEAGGGMLLPPGLDPDSTFRLRSAAAQGARAKLDASLFEAAAREVPEAETTVEGVEPNPVTLAVRRLTSASSTSSPKRRSEGGEGAV